MALVVLLRGVNVGGHRRFRPTALAAELQHLDIVSIGAAGTFVVRQPIGRAQLRAEVSRRLPFDAEIAICRGRDITNLLAQDPFSGRGVRPERVRFVSVLSRSPRLVPQMPVRIPARGRWWVEVFARQDRFVLGLYRRHMSVIGYLGELDRIFGVPVTTRSWNTFVAVAKVLEGRAP